MTDRNHRSAIARVLGGDFARLPQEVRSVHSGSPVHITGRADVERGAGPINRMICAILSFPRHGRDQPVTIKFTTDANGVDHWERDFAGRPYASFLSAGSGQYAGHLVERLGPFTIVFSLAEENNRLAFRMVGLYALGTPVPAWLRPSCVAFEDGHEEKFTFDIAIDLPLFGRLIRYRGALTQP
jgi:hypothetical protein